MGEATVIPGITEEELRRAEVEATLDALDESPPLGPDEFTLRDWRAAYVRSTGRFIKRTTAQRRLEELVENGVLARAPRYDPRIQKRVTGYWRLTTGAEPDTIIARVEEKEEGQA